MDIPHRKKALKLSMTPLIDMVFLLLVFFMLTTSFSNREGIEFNYSQKDGKSSSLGRAKKFLIISVESNGVVLVNDKVSSVNDFAKIVKPKLVNDGSQRVFIQTIGTPIVQDLVSVVDELNMIGARNITFMDDVFEEEGGDFAGWGK